MESWIFALCMLFMHNPHQHEIFAIPPEFSLAIYREAERYDNVDPEDVAAMVVAEHGGGAPYSTDSLGKAGEHGLLQVSKYWLGEFNDEHGTAHTPEDMLDWRLSITIGTFAIHKMKHNHATAARCKRKVWSTKAGENGHLHPVKVKQKHTWIAHYRCNFKARERCKTKWREKLIVRLGRWREVRELVRFEGDAGGWQTPPLQLVGRELGGAMQRAAAELAQPGDG